MAKQPLLDLQTLVERPSITVDGLRYELLSPDELSILDSQRFTGWGRELEKLATADGKADELAALVSTIARRALADMPVAVFEALSEAHRLAIVEVFTGLLLARKMGTAGALIRGLGKVMGAASVPLTGEKSSQDSAGSMAATPDTGSNARPARS